MTEPQEIVDLVEALLEPDWHDPACPFKDHCYCGPDDEPPPHDRVRSHLQVKAAERIKALEEELAKANKPTYFYFDPVEGETFESLHDAVIAAAAEAGANWGRWVIPVYAARTLPLIYAAVRIRTDTGQDCNNRLLFQITECATEAEAKALLKEADQ